jgi:hypothetical protein
MKVTGHQPSLMPYLGFWSKAVACDRFIILPGYQFSYNNRDAFTHRCKIGTDNKNAFLTLPLHHSNDGMFPISIKEAKLKQELMLKRWDTIDQTLSDTKHWHIYKNDLKNIWLSNNNTMSDINIKYIYYLVKLLGIKTEFILHNDLPLGDTPTQKIQYFLNTYGATEYISGSAGIHYLAKDEIITKVMINNPILPDNFKTVSVVSAIAHNGLTWTIDKIFSSINLSPFT